MYDLDTAILAGAGLAIFFVIVKIVEFLLTLKGGK